MKIARNLTLTSAALVATLALAPFVNARHEKNLPPETVVFAQINDIADIEKRWEKHPLKADLDNAKFEEFFAPAIESFEKELKNDKERADMKKFFQTLKRNLKGEVLLAIVKTPKVEKGHLPVDFVCFADTESSEKEIEELLKDAGLLQDSESEISEACWKASTAEKGANAAPKDGDGTQEKMLKITVKKITEKFQGVTLHSTEATVEGEEAVNSGGWALVDKTFVSATAPNVLRELVDALQNGRKNNFTDQAIWKRNSDNIAKPDGLLFLNTPLATAELRAYIAKESAAAPPNMFGVDYLAAYDTLGLDALEAVWISKTIEPERVRIKDSVGFSEKRGLLSLATTAPLKKPVPSYIPDDVAMFATYQWDMVTAFKNFEGLIAKALPGLKPMIDVQISQLKAKEGIDLRTDLFENFGDELAVIGDFVSDSDKFGMEQLLNSGALYVISLREPAKLESLIATVLGKTGGTEAIFDEREFMGVKIRTMKDRTGGTSVDDNSLSVKQPMPYYAILDGKAFIGQGNPKLLEKIIAQSKDGQHPAAKNPNVQEALKIVTKKTYAFSYLELSDYISYLGGTIQVVGELQGKKLVDGTKRPTKDTIPWVVASISEERPNEVCGEMVIFRKVDAKK